MLALIHLSIKLYSCNICVKMTLNNICVKMCKAALCLLKMHKDAVLHKSQIKLCLLSP